jgi:pullulanase/glycogen debranching enzyme
VLEWNEARLRIDEQQDPALLFHCFVKAVAMDVVADISPAPRLESDELWFKDAIIYQLHVRAFADSNNDGIGDFVGLTEKT